MVFRNIIKKGLYLLVALLCVSFVSATLTNSTYYYSLADSSLSGAFITDQTSNGNSGTYAGAQTGFNGILDQSFNFSGSSNVIVPAPYPQTSTGTLCLWLNSTSVSGAHHLFNLRYNNLANKDNIGMYLNGDEFTAQTRQGSAKQWELSTLTANIMVNTWNFVCLRHNGVSPEIWVNGVNQSTSITTSTHKMWWSANYSGAMTNNTIGRYELTANPFDGQIDEINFYPDAKTGTEISDLYNSGNAKNPYNTSITMTLTLVDFYDGKSIQNYTANFTNTTNTTTINTINGSILYESSSLVNITVTNISDTNLTRTHFDQTTLSHNASSNLQMSSWESYHNFSAQDSFGNAVNAFNCSNSKVSFSTTTGNYSNLRVRAGTLYVLCDSGSYSTVNHTFYDSYLFRNSSTIEFGNSSINITFYDETDNTLYNNSPVTLQVANLNFGFSVNYTTSNGTILIPTIPTSLYQIYFYSNASNARYIYVQFPLAPNKFDVDLYILDTGSDTKNRAFIVQDENGDRVLNATINVSKFFVTAGLKSVGTYRTDVSGIATLDQDDYSIYYYAISYNGQIKLTDTDFFVHAVDGATRTFTISISEDEVGQIIDISQAQLNMSYNNVSNEFEFSWYDDTSTISGICLELYKQTNQTLINRSCYTGTAGSGTMFYNVSGIHELRGFFNVSNTLKYKNLAYSILVDQYITKNFLFIMIIWTLVSFVLFLSVDWKIAMLMSLVVPEYIFIKTGLFAASLAMPTLVTLLIIIIYLMSRR